MLKLDSSTVEQLDLGSDECLPIPHDEPSLNMPKLRKLRFVLSETASIETFLARLVASSLLWLHYPLSAADSPRLSVFADTLPSLRRVQLALIG